MREIVLDTETTGLDPNDGHRIVEIGAVELYNHLPTGQTWHRYVNPQRSMPKEAFEVHGIGDDHLRDKPLFAEIGQAFLDFVGDAQLVIHNASFDMKFLNFELKRAGFSVLPAARATDTLAIARQRFPGSPASLDALCRRFGVDNSKREKHGALLDSEILAEIYLELVGGRQPDLMLKPTKNTTATDQDGPAWRPTPRVDALAVRTTKEEREAHAAFVSAMGDGAIWKTRA